MFVGQVCSSNVPVSRFVVAGNGAANTKRVIKSQSCQEGFSSVTMPKSPFEHTGSTDLCEMYVTSYRYRYVLFSKYRNERVEIRSYIALDW